MFNQQQLIIMQKNIMQEKSNMKLEKSHKQVLQAFLFFSSPLQKPLDQKKFQQSICTLESMTISQTVQLKLMPLLIQRYYQLCKSLQEYKLEQYLVNKFICVMITLIKSTNLKQEQMLIVITWAAVNHLKKCIPQNDHKQGIKNVLFLLSEVVDRLICLGQVSVQKIYPQLSAVLINYSFNVHTINHIIFRQTLAILASMLSKLFFNKNFIQKGIQLNESQKSFQQQCIIRVQSYLKFLSTKVASLQLAYQDSVYDFIVKIWPIGIKFIQILNPLAIISAVVGYQCPYELLQSPIVKIIKSNLTLQFIQQIDKIGTNILERKNSLRKIQRLAQHIQPSLQQCEQILRKFTNSLYLIHNNKSLIIPHLTGQSSSLIHLQALHSFSNYPIGLTAMLQSFDFECERVLVSKMPFAETSLTNVTLLKSIIYKMSAQSSNILLQLLTQAISNQQNEYLVDMSLTKFCQYLTKCLLIYWILRKPDFKPRMQTALNLLQIFNSCQALRVLQPSFEQQEILIGFSLLSSYYCYKCLTTQNKQRQDSKQELKQIKLLKLKLSLLQIAINNVNEHSPIIKLGAYYILLSQSAPNSVGQMLQNLHTTLTNRNIRNIKFIMALIKLCDLSDPECLDLAERFTQYSGTQQLIKIILPRLPTEMIRKCLLSASGADGKWILMLLNNTRLLYKKEITQSDQYLQKSQNFYMNDGPNVKITNALGVVLLQLGSKWQYCLKLDCPYKEIAIDLILQILDLDTTMVFFQNRFISIFQCLINLLIGSQLKSTQAVCNQRIKLKIYKIMAKIPHQNYKIYKKDLIIKKQDPQLNDKIQKVRRYKVQDSQTKLIRFRQLLQKDQKIYKKNYFLNSNDSRAGQLYDMVQEVINKFNKNQE